MSSVKQDAAVHQNMSNRDERNTEPQKLLHPAEWRNHQVWMLRQTHSALPHKELRNDLPDLLSFHPASKHTTDKHKQSTLILSEGWFPSGPLEKFSCLTAPARRRLAIMTPSHTDIVCLCLVLPEGELTKILAYGTAHRGRKMALRF